MGVLIDARGVGDRGGRHRLGVHIRDPWTSQTPVIAVFFRECALDVETNER